MEFCNGLEKVLDKNSKNWQRYIYDLFPTSNIRRPTSEYGLYDIMRPPLVNDCFYHIYNRGVLKQPIFFEEKDYIRFVHDLYEFNDTHNAPRFECSASNDRVPLVSILAWALMPNHFHLFLQQRIEGGVSLFLKKLGGGYTMYVNEKYKRSGHVFQGRYKAKPVENDAYFLHLSRYIHLNPTELLDPNANSDELTEKSNKTQQFLMQYRWSSYLDWIGTKNFPSVLDSRLVEQMRQISGREYYDFVSEWLENVKSSDVRRRMLDVGMSCYTSDI